MTVILKCSQCGTEKTKSGQAFKNASALNTHMNMHCEKKPLKVAEGKHVHKWNLLNGNLVDHARAINAGHTKLCSCGEVE